MNKERLLNEAAAARLESLPYCVEVLHYKMGPALIDIERDAETLQAWIYCGSYGVKSFMFGVDAESVTLAEFLQMVEANAPDYFRDYLEEMEEQ